LAKSLRRQVHQVQWAASSHHGQAALLQVAPTNDADIERIAEHLNERAEVVLASIEDPILTSRRVKPVESGLAEEPSRSVTGVKTSPRTPGASKRKWAGV
jgi:hypothetical protein